MFFVITINEKVRKMRLIDKLPKVPDLNEQSIHMITDLLFVPDKPFNQHSDNSEYDINSALQIMGNIAFLKDMFNDNILSKISTYYSVASRLIITGGINPAYTEDNEETKLVKYLYTENGKYNWKDVLTIPQSVIINSRLQRILNNPWNGKNEPLLDTKSSNTKENFICVNQIGGYKGITQIRMLTTAESTLRVIATARKVLSGIQDIGTISYIPTFPEFNIVCDRNNWANHKLSQRYVYGEFLRIVKYNEKEEINLTDIEKTKMKDIIKELSNQR